MRFTRRTSGLLAAAAVVLLTAAPPAGAAEPKLTVAKAKLNAALKCAGEIDGASRTPIMLVTGTGASGDEAYAIGKDALDSYGAPVCYVNFPNFTTADVQVSVQYLVDGLRVMSRRAGRKVAVIGISQGALLPRVALTYWPSLRRKVSDVIAAAGTQHGTTSGRALACRREKLACIPAAWQQAAGSDFLRALNAQPDETPGPTSWTTVRSATDEVVQPQSGPRPTSALKGATNVLIQSVCPGRQVTHIGTVLDSVAFELAKDAISHRGPAKVSRLPGDVCSHPYATGLDEEATRSVLAAAGGLTASRYDEQPKVRREPKLRAWTKRRTLSGLAPSARAAAKRPTRDVLVVSNNWAGTADLIDPHSFKRLKRLNVVPDRKERIAEISADPTAKFYYDNIRALVGEGHDQYVDDGFTSPDGRTVYFSRPSFADVVAINLETGKLRWRTHVDGYRADHMALSENGRRLLVSASTAGVIDSIDTRTGEITARIPSGDSPHENNFSRDGSLIFHASIGTVYTDTDDPSQDGTKGRRVFEVIDAGTNRVLKEIDMGRKLAEAGYPGMSSAVRPMAITPNERYVFFQVSFFFGIVQYDLRTDKVVAVLRLPLGAAQGVDRTDYLLDSAHHGLAMNPKGTKLCVAGTMSGYAAIVTRKPLELQRTTKVGSVPYWSHSSEDGRYCFVSVAGEDRVAVISYKTGRQVKRIKVGDHPQRMRTGVIRRAYVR